jgi:aminopeptidase
VITSVLRNVFRINLGIRKNERCLIFTDTPSPAENVGSQECERRSRLQCIAFLAAEIGKEYAKEVIFHEYPSTGSHGVEPPAELWERAFGRKAVAALKRKKILGPLLKK